MNAKLLVLLLAAIVGGSVWLALSRTTAPIPVGGPAEPAANAAAAPAAAPLVTAQGAVVDPVAVVAVGEDAKRTEAAPAPNAAVATVMVRGRVVDPAGNPRAGVEVSLWTTPIDSDLPEDFDFPVAPPSPGEFPTAKTGADGRFAMPLDANRRGSVDVDDDRYVQRGGRAAVRGDKGDQDVGDVTTILACVLRGRVQDEAGKPIADAKVMVETGYRLFGERSMKSAADGAFEVGKVEPGKNALRVARAGFLPSLTELELQPEEQRDGLVVTLRTGKAIAGRVVDERGVGVAAAKVGAKRKELLDGMAIERFVAEEATSSDANGWFTLAGLADDTVTVSAFGKEHTTATAAGVAVGTMDVVLRVERLGAIEGVLVGADGAPIAGSEVALGGGLGEANFVDGDDMELSLAPTRRNQQARTGADGAFRLEGVSPGTVTVRATGKGHRPARVDGVKVIAAQTTSGVRLVADRGAVARVRVVDAAGAPVAGAKVRAVRPAAREPGVELGGGNVAVTMRATSVAVGDDGPDLEILGDGSLAAGTTDADGRCELAGLPAGEAEFTAKHKDHADAAPTTVVLPASGGVDVALALRVPGFVAVTVLGPDGKPVGSAEVLVTPAEGEDDIFASDEARGRIRLTTDAEGKATSPALAPGAYRAVLTRSSKGRGIGGGGARVVMIGGEPETLDDTRVDVAVAAGKTAEATLRQPVLARVHGVVTGVGGPIAGCEVELRRNGEFAAFGLGDDGPTTTTGADGAYAFEEVTAGEYTLAFGRPKALAKAETPCEVPAGVADLRVDLELRTGTARLRALDAATGKPVVGADVEIRRHENRVGGARVARSAVMIGIGMTGDEDGGGMTTMTFGEKKLRTDEQGVVVFEDVPVGEWAFEVKHKAFAPANAGPVVVAERQTADAGDVQLAAAGSVRGTVTAANGGKVGMAMVQRRRVGETEWSEPVMAMGGKFRVPGLGAGRYELRAREIDLGEPGAGDSAGPIVEVEVKAGETAQVELRTK